MRRIPWLSCLSSLSVCFAVGYATHYVVNEFLPPLPEGGRWALCIIVVCIVGTILWKALWHAIRSELQ